MSALIVNLLDIYPKYETKELKIHIRKNTYSGFAVTSSLLLLILFFTLLHFSNVNSDSVKVIYTSIPSIDLVDLMKEKPIEVTITIPKEITVLSGTIVRAGRPVAIPDALVSPDVNPFADVSNIGKSSPEGGDKPSLAGLLPIDGFEGKDKINIANKIEPELDPGIFVPVEKDPGVDIVRLQSLVKYPEIARKAGIEGKVFVRVLVDKDGTVLKNFVENSDNILLDKAAIDAIKNYGKFLPAIQNGETIKVWITIPIQFKLK